MRVGRLRSGAALTPGARARPHTPAPGAPRRARPSSQRLAAAILALFCGAGCAEIEPTDDRPSSIDALVSGGQGGQGGQGGAADQGAPAQHEAGLLPPLFDVGFSPGGGLGDASVPPLACVPGAKLSLCSVCGPDGVPTLPPDGHDGACPQADCEARAHYERFVDGRGFVGCQITTYQPAQANCLQPGQCRPLDDAQLCTARPGARVLVADHECAEIEGCEGPEEGRLVAPPTGRACAEGAGRCTGLGICDTRAVQGCAEFQELGEICGLGTHPSYGDYCSVAVEQPASCTAQCAQLGRLCVGAIRQGASACEEEGGYPCHEFEEGLALICLCRINP